MGDDLITQQKTPLPKQNTANPQVLNQGKNTRFIIIPVTLTILLVVTSLIVFLSSKKENAVPSNESSNKQLVNFTSNGASYNVFYNKNNDIFGLDTNSQEKRLVIGEELVYAAPNGRVFTTKRGNQYVLRTTDEKAIQLELGLKGALWSSNSRYAQFALSQINESREDYSKLPTLEVWDLETGEKTKGFDVVSQGYTDEAIFNDGNLLLRKILNTTSIDEDNVELFLMNTQNKQISSLGTLRFSSMPPKLSPDNSKLGFSDGTNLRVYDLKTKELNSYTNFERNQETVWNVYWSQDGKYLAFQTFGNISLGERIGILNIETNEIQYIDENFISSFMSGAGLDPSARIVTFVPRGWNETSDSIFVQLETIVDADPGVDIPKKYRYWLYDINTQQMTYLPMLNDVVYPYFTSSSL